MVAASVIADFVLPIELEAGEPPEARGLKRDEVRLLVSDIERDSIDHARFKDLPGWLSAGDLLVVNTSGTLNAALPVMTETREAFGLITGLHEPLATHLTLLERVVTGAMGQRPVDAQTRAGVRGRCHLERAYAEARREGYLWHEFGDSHLILGADGRAGHYS